MAGITQNYIFDPRGDGVRYPIRQTAARGSGGLLPPGVASKLYARRHAKPNVFASTITSRYNAANVIPSSFSQYGRGTGYRRKARPSGTRYGQTFGGRKSDPLRLFQGRGGYGRSRWGGAFAFRNAIVNPGSW
jgi:hypothetical protein